MDELISYDLRLTLKEGKSTGILPQLIEEVIIENFREQITYYFSFTAHLRTGSAGSLGGIFNQPRQRNSLHLPSPPVTQNAPTTPKPLQEELRCLLESQHQGHQQPVTCMHVAGSVVFTGNLF